MCKSQSYITGLTDWSNIHNCDVGKLQKNIEVFACKIYGLKTIEGGNIYSVTTFLQTNCC